jgi:hypothetical protein
MSKDDYLKQEAQRKADKEKLDAANEMHRRNMNNKAEYRRKEGEKNLEAARKLGEKKGTGGCFVATAAYGDYNAPEVVYLSTFRDDSLNQSVLGRVFIRAYYAISPRFAAIIVKSNLLRSVARNFFLQPMIFLLRLIRRSR